MPRMILLLLAGGLVALTVGAEVLVKGAVRLARAVGLSSLVIGLTVVAFGTSAPELAVSVKAALSGQADLALGNVIGSNVFNVLFILGLSALIIPLAVSSQLVRLDVPVMIGVSLLAWVFASDGSVGRVEGIALVTLLVAYTAGLVVVGRRDRDVDAPGEGEGAPVRPPRRSLLAASAYVVAGLVLLVLGSRWFTAGAAELARSFGVSELTIGLTVVAAGTSLPEVATSVLAALRGQREIAVGNAVGSNTFNILSVLGWTASVAPTGVGVAPTALRFDLPIMAAVALVCLPIFFTGGRISRLEGATLLGFYFSYVTFLVLAAREHASLRFFAGAMLWFAIPLALIGIVYSVLLALHERRRAQQRP